MQDELVDIVDEARAILYSTTKADAHQKGLLHRTVIAEVRDSKGNWILVQQSADRQDAGQYVSPVGGHVQAGANRTKMHCCVKHWKRSAWPTLSTNM